MSDSWLIPDKRKRLLITAAGGFLDLCVWATAVFVWRITVPGVLVNQLALIVLTVTGGRSFLNLNPLLRLDGYYLMSDWLSIPNLRSRGKARWMEYLRWILWGAARPTVIPQGNALLWYGFACWVFALGLLNIILIRFMRFMTTEFGLTGLAVICLFLLFGFRRVFKGLFESEFSAMIKTRPKRTAVWLTGIAAASILLFVVPVRSSSSGNFEVRPGSIVQIDVPVSGIVDEILVDDGDVVREGQVLLRLRSSDLASQIQTTKDVFNEVQANLQRLKLGTRPEEIAAQQQQVSRLEAWYQLGVEEQEQANVAHEQEVLIEENRIREALATLEFARQNLAHSERLYRQGALAGAQLRSERLEILQAESRLAQSEATLRAVQARGTRSKEAEIDRRRQELESARERLAIMEAGSRPEDIAAEEARMERVRHEVAYLAQQRQRLEIRAAADGVVSAQRLREQLGRALAKDSVVGSIEDPTQSWVEIAVPQEHAPLVKAGLPVTLKARAVPFESFKATVETIAPAVRNAAGEATNTVIVHCHINNPDGRLKPGMTGFGRIHREWRSMGTIMLSSAMKYIRTEFWW